MSADTEPGLLLRGARTWGLLSHPVVDRSNLTLKSLTDKALDHHVDAAVHTFHPFNSVRHAPSQSCS